MGLLDNLFDLYDRLSMSEEDKNYNDAVKLLESAEYKRAFEKLIMVAEGGSTLALENLWQIFQQGDLEDKENVSGYYLYAARKGNANAFSYLWKIYPHVGAENMKVIAESFVEAAESGNLEVVVYLSEIFLAGEICDQDIERAESLLNVAASAGEMVAYYHLGMMVLNGYCEGKTTSEGIHLIERAAEAGVGIALCKIGEMYLNGEHLPLDYLKARQYIQEAAKCGCEEAEILYHANTTKLYSVTQPSPSQATAESYHRESHYGDPSPSVDCSNSTEKKGSRFQYSHDAKVCLTCNYWNGTREMNSSRTLAYTYSDKNNRSLGRCMHTHYMHINRIQSYSYTCDRFCKWTHLT